MYRNKVWEKRYELIKMQSYALNRWNKEFACLQHEYAVLLNYFRQLKNRGLMSEDMYAKMMSYRVSKPTVISAADYKKAKRVLKNRPSLDDAVAPLLDEVCAFDENWGSKHRELVLCAVKLNRMDEDYVVMQFDYTDTLCYFRRQRNNGCITEEEYRQIADLREPRIQLRDNKAYEEMLKSLG